jgi:hypothetical protein
MVMWAFLFSFLGLVGLVLWIRFGMAVSAKEAQSAVATWLSWIILSFLLGSGLFFIVGFGFGKLVNESPNLTVLILVISTWGIYQAGSIFGAQASKASEVAATKSLSAAKSAALPPTKPLPALEESTGYGPPSKS